MRSEVCKESIPDVEIKPNHVKDDLVSDSNIGYKDEKYCPGCNQHLKRSCFDRNKSKRDGLESNCKICVSSRKRRAYAKKKKRAVSISRNVSFPCKATVIGDLEEETILRFAKLFEEVYRGLRYEGKI